MTIYTPNIPQPSDIPADGELELMNNFLALNQVFNVNHVPYAQPITFISPTNPAQITSANHGIPSGLSVTVTINFLQAPSTLATAINGNTYTVTVIDANTFSIPVNATTLSSYVVGSIAWYTSSLSGYH